MEVLPFFFSLDLKELKDKIEVKIEGITIIMALMPIYALYPEIIYLFCFGFLLWKCLLLFI